MTQRHPSPDEFAAALVAYAIDRDPLAEITFRHPNVVQRTATTATRLLRDHGPLVRQQEGESRNEFTRRAKRARAAVQFEQQLANLIVRGDAARLGRPTNDPSPSARAARRLAAQRPEEYLTLLREEQKREQKAHKARRR